MRALVIAIIAMFICIAAILVFATNPSLLKTIIGGSTSQTLSTVYTTKHMSALDMEVRRGSVTIVASRGPIYRVEASSGCSVSVSGSGTLEIVVEGSSGCRVVIEAPPQLSYVTLYVRSGSVEIDGLSVGTLAATLISSTYTLNGVTIGQSLYLYLFSSQAELNGVEMARGSSGSIKLFSSTMKATFSDRVEALLDSYMSSVSNRGCVSGPTLKVLARTSSVVLSCPGG